MKMYLEREAITKQRADKKRLSPFWRILNLSAGLSRTLDQAKQTEAQPAKMANPTLVMDVVSKELLPKVKRMKMPPAMKMSSSRTVKKILIVF